MSNRDRRNLVGAVLIGIRQVKIMSGYRSTTTIYDKMKNADFPESITLLDGSGSVRWIESEVQDWVDEQITAYRNQAVAS